MKNSFMVLAGCASAVLLCMGDSCSGSEDQADAIQHRAQAQTELQAVQSVGMPAITNFQEKRTLKQIYELRDTSLSTITYIVDLNGRLHKLCDSIGFGIPYATEYTSPQKDIWATTASSVHMGMPQADPNGLFSPPSAEGTWVLCLNPQTKKASPLYVEPRIITSPFPISTD